jgi:hypothetical protein
MQVQPVFYTPRSVKESGAFAMGAGEASRFPTAPKPHGAAAALAK